MSDEIQQNVELNCRFDGDFFKKIQMRRGELYVNTDDLELVDAQGTRSPEERDRRIARINYFLGKGLVDAYVDSTITLAPARAIEHRWKGRIRLTDYGRRFLAEIVASVEKSSLAAKAASPP